MKIDLSSLIISELKTRKKWLIFFWIGIFQMFISLTMLFFLVEFGSEEYLRNLSEKLFDFSIFLIGSYIFYHSAYKKPGTKLLTLYRFLKPIHLFLISLLIFYFPFPYGALFVAALLIFHVIFYILSWKLRKINVKLIETAIYPEEYTQLARSIKLAQTLEEAQSEYSILMKKWPQYGKFSTILYKRIQEKLSTNPNYE